MGDVSAGGNGGLTPSVPLSLREEGEGTADGRQLVLEATGDGERPGGDVAPPLQTAGHGSEPYPAEDEREPEDRRGHHE